ncbi:MAG: hypothetical protein KGQ37_09845 [Hyphomicrobiales bacterium]|nr:hypothetical protein [Hyphomicrobiales bacterium]
MAQIWFRPKRYGFGATPVSWQGWLVTLGGALALAMTVAAAMLAANGRIAGGKGLAIALALLAIIIVVKMTILTLLHTEGSWRWRWGGK